MILRKSVLKLLTTANPTNHRGEGGSCTLYTKILKSVDLVDMVHSWSTCGIGSLTAVFTFTITSITTTAQSCFDLLHLFEVLLGLSDPQSVRPQKSPGHEAASSVSPWQDFDERPTFCYNPNRLTRLRDVIF